MKDCKKKIILFVAVSISLITVALISVYTVKVVRAASVVDRSSIILDENLSDQEGNTYAPVDKIALTQISAPSGMQFGDSDDWVQGLYYYSITKLGFADVPFNYVVTWQGDVYRLKGGGMDVAPLISSGSVENFGNVVLVGYFDNNQETTNIGKKSLTDLVSELLSEYDLESDAVVAVDSSITNQDPGVVLSTLDIFDSEDQYWNGIVGEVRSTVIVPEKAETDRLEASLVDVIYPETVDAGEEFIVTAKFKNEGTRPWYSTGDHAVLVATSDPRNRESSLFVSDKWASFSRVVPATEDWVLPGEEGSFVFEIDTPLVPGDYEESFELLSLPDRWFDDSQFTVSFAVKKGDFDLLEILDTETGYLNVRDCPSQGCEEVGKVTPGEVYVNLDYSEGWYKIRLDDGGSGWVYGKYAKAL